MKSAIKLTIVGVVLTATVVSLIVVWFGYRWCPRGHSLLIQHKTGQPADRDAYATEGQQGMLERMRGPGRYFDLNRWNYDVQVVPDVDIPARKIGVITNKIGKTLPRGRFLAGPGEKGTQKRVLTPGKWRINTFGQKVEIVDAIVIPPGYVGVQKLEEDIPEEGKKKGIQDEVLQSGYYNINPNQISVKQVEIGYRVWEQKVQYEQVAVNRGGRRVYERRIKEGTGVSFPLADGKEMHLDLAVVWGIFPENAPRITREYGQVSEVENKIIEPQVLSICKNAGSNLTTQQFIEGETREKFQQNVTNALKKIGEKKGINFLIALVRGFHPDAEIKKTIQARMLAEEEKTTLKFQQERDTVAAELEQAKREVEVALKDFDAETEAIVQEELERGKKKAAEIQAQADLKVAGLKKQAAEIQAQITKILGQADADVIQATQKAEATKLELLIQAYGGPDAYNLATFANGLPNDIQIEYRYAGEGTFWTDAKGDLKDIAARKLLEREARGKP